jgi:hypothetical protein
MENINGGFDYLFIKMDSQSTFSSFKIQNDQYNKPINLKDYLLKLKNNRKSIANLVLNFIIVFLTGLFIFLIIYFNDNNENKNKPANLFFTYGLELGEDCDLSEHKFCNVTQNLDCSTDLKCVCKQDWYHNEAICGNLTISFLFISFFQVLINPCDLNLKILTKILLKNV